MVDVQGSAVVDQPGAAVPDEQVRVLDRPIGVRDERIEPDDVGSEVGVDQRARVADGGVEGEGARQEVHPEIGPAARSDQVVDLLVGLGVAESRIDLDRDEVRNRQPDRPADLAGQPFRDERTGTLPGTPELDDVQAIVVTLDETRQRAALPQRRHVPRRDDRPHHRQSLPDSAVQDSRGRGPSLRGVRGNS